MENVAPVGMVETRAVEDVAPIAPGSLQLFLESLEGSVRQLQQGELDAIGVGVRIGQEWKLDALEQEKHFRRFDRVKPVARFGSNEGRDVHAAVC